MSVKSFKFISPGIFINEIDNSQLPAVADEMGPVIIGRTERGPAMRPVKVNSFSEYVQTFGNPIPGGQGGDVWRDGNYTAPTYAAFAAQAYLRNSNAVTMVRLLGGQKSGLSSQVAKPKMPQEQPFKTRLLDRPMAVHTDYSFSTLAPTGLVFSTRVPSPQFGI